MAYNAGVVLCMWVRFTMTLYGALQFDVIWERSYMATAIASTVSDVAENTRAVSSLPLHPGQSAAMWCAS